MEKKVSYRVENIVRKAEIACYQQFLIFSQCFPQLYFLVRQNAASYGNGINDRAERKFLITRKVTIIFSLFHNILSRSRTNFMIYTIHNTQYM